MEREIFERAELLLGREALERLARKRVIVFGVGGVGSWCVETLVRTGIRNLTIVDSDTVSFSNINRQLMATTITVGRPKVEVLKERLLAINPDAHIVALQRTYSEDTSETFHLEEYDVILDCIDSLKDKAHLILTATRMRGQFFSSMGAARKTDPLKIQIAEFWKVKGCPLAKALRQRFKHRKEFPAKKFKCAFSDELLDNREKREEGGRIVNGSLMQVTAAFGLALASAVVSSAIET